MASSLRSIPRHLRAPPGRQRPSASSLEPARRAIQSEPQSPSDLTPREKIGELYKFATSDLYADLRGAIGVAVGGETD